MTEPRDRERLLEQWLDSSLAEVLGGVRPAAAARARAEPSTPPSRQPSATPRRVTVSVGALVMLLGAAVLVMAFVFGRSERARGDVKVAESATLETARPEAGALRVLYLGDSPGWGYRYLRSSFAASSAIRLDACLVALDRESSRSAGLTSWSAIAADFDDHGVILLGDLSPDAIVLAGGDPARFLSRLEAFVAAGGGLGIFCDGKNMPGSWVGTSLQSLLPIESLGGLTDCEIHAQVRPEHLDHPLFRAMGTAEAASLFDGALEIQVTLATLQALGRARDGAQILIADRDDTTLPLLAVAEHRSGRLAMLAIEDVWRMRPERPAVVDAFRTSLVRWLGGQLAPR